MGLFIIAMASVCWWIAVSTLCAIFWGWEKLSESEVGKIVDMISDSLLKKISDSRVEKILYMISDWRWEKIEYMISVWELENIVNMFFVLVWSIIISAMITLDSGSKMMADTIFSVIWGITSVIQLMTLCEILVSTLEIPLALNSKNRPIQSNHLNPNSDMAPSPSINLAPASVGSMGVTPTVNSEKEGGKGPTDPIVNSEKEGGKAIQPKEDSLFQLDVLMKFKSIFPYKKILRALGVTPTVNSEKEGGKGVTHTVFSKKEGGEAIHQKEDSLFLKDVLERTVNMFFVMSWTIIIYAMIVLDLGLKIMPATIFFVIWGMTSVSWLMISYEIVVSTLEIPLAPNSKNRPIQSNHLNPNSDVAPSPSIDLDPASAESLGVTPTVNSEKEGSEAIQQKEDSASEHSDQSKWQCDEIDGDNGWQIIEKDAWLHE